MKRQIDFQLLKIIGIYYGAIKVISFSVSLGMWIKDAKEPLHWFRLIFHYLIFDWITVTLSIMLLAILVKIMFVKKIKIKYTIVIHLMLSIVFNAVLFIGSLVSLNIFYNVKVQDLLSRIRVSNFLKLFDYNFIIYTVMMGMIYVYYYWKEFKESERKRLILKEQMSEIQANILKYQLHPHFFFNTLNSISALIDYDPKVAQNTLADFSDLLRDLLYLKDTNFMTIKEEMNILDKYIDIMKIRYSGHLIIKKHIDKGLDYALIPTLILQPIFENSLMHGYSYNNTKLEIEFSIVKIDEQILIIIENNGKLLEENIVFGTGLKNTKDRLKTLYDDNYKFVFCNKEDKKGVITKIVIPCIYE